MADVKVQNTIYSSSRQQYMVRNVDMGTRWQNGVWNMVLVGCDVQCNKSRISYFCIQNYIPINISILWCNKFGIFDCMYSLDQLFVRYLDSQHFVLLLLDLSSLKVTMVTNTYKTPTQQKHNKKQWKTKKNSEILLKNRDSFKKFDVYSILLHDMQCNLFSAIWELFLLCKQFTDDEYGLLYGLENSCSFTKF